MAAIGNEKKKALGISVINEEVFIWKIQRGEEEIVNKTSVNKDISILELQFSVEEGDRYSFSWRAKGQD